MDEDNTPRSEDEALPKAMIEYLEMWNAPDLETAQRHMEMAVSDDVVFADPRDFHTGKDALLRNVRRFKRAFPDAALGLRSGVDSQNNRYRYEWRISQGGTVVLDGFDVTTLDDDGRIERVDGFFGELPQVGEHRSA